MNGAAGLVSGLIAAGYLTAGLYFLRFRQQSGDRLFAFFAAAFWILAGQRILLTLFGADEEVAVILYALRAFAFLIIIYAIIDRNRKQPG